MQLKSDIYIVNMSKHCYGCQLTSCTMSKYDKTWSLQDSINYYCACMYLYPKLEAHLKGTDMDNRVSF